MTNVYILSVSLFFFDKCLLSRLMQHIAWRQYNTPSKFYLDILNIFFYGIMFLKKYHYLPSFFFRYMVIKFRYFSKIPHETSLCVNKNDNGRQIIYNNRYLYIIL